MSVDLELQRRLQLWFSIENENQDNLKVNTANCKDNRIYLRFQNALRSGVEN